MGYLLILACLWGGWMILKDFMEWRYTVKAMSCKEWG